MKHEHINEIKAIVVLALGLILLASFVSFVPEDLSWYTSHPNNPTKNLIGVVGAYAAGASFFIFGYSAFALVFVLLFCSWNKFTSREITFSLYKFLSSLVLLCVLSSLFGLLGPEISTTKFVRAGMVGTFLSDFLVQYLGKIGAFIILLTFAALSLIIIGEFLVSFLFMRVTEKTQEWIDLIKEKVEEKKEVMALGGPKASILTQGAGLLDSLRFKEKKARQKEKIEKPDTESFSETTEENKIKPGKPQIRITDQDEEKVPVMSRTEPEVIGEYKMPSLDLLDDPPHISSSKIQSDLVSGAKVLEATLGEFNVSVRVADIERGPVITRYELEPAPGVKVQQITTLSDDIALAMKASSVRIVAPIPGKNRVGIEVPNGASASVYLKDVLAQSQLKSSGSKLMLSLGKDIAGKPILADLAEMPHLLIAGTTGSGKTVCVNSIIMSMLFNAAPHEVKFLMIDPKMVELSIYSDIPHCLCPAVTDPKKVSSALNWVVGEMESRYAMLSKAGVRNIKAYNARGHNLPYIVVIIDELADLMQVAAKTIESAITRLAQLSRAVGIHLILATQRPSVDVITGVIKANFPARISFKVASKVDSRTVLDMNGAENLLGRGDLLFLKPGDAKPTRGQCSFVQDPEIQRVISFIKEQQDASYDESILSHQAKGMTAGVQQKDELYDDALRLVLETNQASVSILQRRMRLGYTRAARLIDMMEQNGIVGPYCGSKPRDILIDREEWLLKNMNKENKEE